MTAYFDSSALVKLAVAEAETPALRAWRASTGQRTVSSLLGRIELVRTIARAGGPGRAGRAVLDHVELIGITPEIADRAADLEPVTLRTLDAIHLATALEVADGLTAFVSYDRRLVDAATALGLPVVSPA